MEASVAGRILCEKTGILNIRNQEQICRQLQYEAKLRDLSIEETMKIMIAKWEKYREARQNLTYAFSSTIKFFESSIWPDENYWPWKEGCKPRKIKVERISKPADDVLEWKRIWEAERSMP